MPARCSAVTVQCGDTEQGERDGGAGQGISERRVTGFTVTALCAGQLR